MADAASSCTSFSSRLTTPFSSARRSGSTRTPLPIGRRWWLGSAQISTRARLRNPDTRRRLAELLADPMQVADLEDHDLLYADVSQLHHLGHLLDSPSGDPEPGPRTDDAAMTLESIARELAASVTNIVYVTLNPSDLAP